MKRLLTDADIPVLDKKQKTEEKQLILHNTTETNVPTVVVWYTELHCPSDILLTRLSNIMGVVQIVLDYAVIQTPTRVCYRTPHHPHNSLHTCTWFRLNGKDMQKLSVGYRSDTPLEYDLGFFQSDSGAFSKSSMEEFEDRLLFDPYNPTSCELWDSGLSKDDVASWKLTLPEGVYSHYQHLMLSFPIADTVHEDLKYNIPYPIMLQRYITSDMATVCAIILVRNRLVRDSPPCFGDYTRAISELGCLKSKLSDGIALPLLIFALFRIGWRGVDESPELPKFSLLHSQILIEGSETMEMLVSKWLLVDKETKKMSLVPAHAHTVDTLLVGLFMQPLPVHR